ncbi:MAG TPA: hypothetical protein VJ986_11785 [Gaiellaceae bacterium]|nr:hypothetical protein [Gaiellaceae bacterium]
MGTVFGVIGMRRAVFAPAAALAVAAALVAAGCGSSSPKASSVAPPTTPAAPSSSAKQAVADALAQTLAAHADVQVQVVLRKSGASRPLAYQANGVVAAGSGSLKIDRSHIGDEIVNEVFTHPNGRLVIYLTSPSTLKQIPAGKTWLKVDMTLFALKQYGADTSFLAAADQDPFQPLELTQSPAAKVRDLGMDWLPDRTLNHRYEATVSILAAGRAAGVKAKGLAAMRKALGNPTQTIDVWVSKAGYVARTVVKGPEKTQLGTLQLQETTDFTNFGAKTSVTVPPAAKSASYFSLTKK